MTSPEQISGLVRGLTHTARPPILRTPADYGLEFEDVTFTAVDGVELSGWFIPADSERLVIANHPMPCNRYGYPGHVAPFDQFIDFEVNFLPDYRNLHDAGYNVLAYDLRNHGRSGEANKGVVTIGEQESRDVLASLRYGRERLGLTPDGADGNDRIGLLSRCLGADSTFVAFDREPGRMVGIAALVAVQPVSLGALARSALGYDEAAYAAFAPEYRAATGYDPDELDPSRHAAAVTAPTLIAQVHHDANTTPADVERIHAAVGAQEKELLWIEGTTRRFDGYNYFPENPERMVTWFRTHLG
ncbi:alpha/beta hydrolase [Tsukamurella sp. NPDC003166]|uniref:alpha/beta hydrolase family protein n=1 Tax=Tsukamurella sp. NPDC003166 TaxID=3154444 RepID=UPI00339EB9D2